MKTDVFRFSVSRITEKSAPDDERVIESKESDLKVKLGDARKAAADPLIAMRGVAKAFVDHDESGNTDYVSLLSDLNPKLRTLDDAVPDSPGFAKKVNELANDVSPDDLVSWIGRVDDSLSAAIVLSDQNFNDAVSLDKARRLLSVIEKAQLTQLNDENTKKYFERTLVLPKTVFPLPGSEKYKAAAKADLAKRQERLKKQQESQDELVRKLRDNQLAIKELASVYEDDFIEGLIKQGNEPVEKETRTSTDSNDSILTRFFGALRGTETITPAPNTKLGVLSAERASNLSAATKETLKHVGMSETDLHVPYTLRALENNNASLGKSLYSGGKTGRAVLLAGGFAISSDFVGDMVVEDFDIHIPGACPLPENGEADVKEPTVPAGVGTFDSLGVSELMVVKQRLLRYEMGEVAHIENVMASEQRDREHRVLKRTETFELDETETTEENEQDLSSTERFELQSESQKTIDEDSSRYAGVTVSGSYGPSVEFSANAGYTSATAKSKSSLTATSHAREITERSVHRIQERVRKERSTLSINEIEVINQHGFLNREKDARHISGIYRWVDKVYEARVYNYGKRELIEVMVPEPAALYRYMHTSAPKEGVTLARPEEPGYCSGRGHTFEPLEPKHMNSVSAMFWASRYNVAGITPPPPLYEILGVGLATKTDEKKPKEAQADNSLKVFDGYVAKRGVFNGNKVVFTKDGKVQHAGLAVYVGRHYMPPSKLKSLNDETGTVPIAILAANTPAFAGTVEVECQRTSEHLQEWQLKTYNAVMNAYEEQKAAYDAALAELGIFDETPTIEGRNPAINREVERREIKRSVISQLTGQHFDDFDAMRKSVSPHGYPQADLAESSREGQYIRFVEQAFEWENMQYLFYPYFWGRKSDWPTINQMTDNDPVFEAFLQAGACRVNIPIRPGFEAAANAFLSTGTFPWNGDESNPTVADKEPFMSIAEEMKSQQGAIDVKSNGTVSIEKNNTNVTGNKTNFTEDDVKREITIGGDVYLIKSFINETSITLDEPYKGESITDGDYVIGAKAVGVPWTVRIPTSLVILQQSMELPVFPETESEAPPS